MLHPEMPMSHFDPIAATLALAFFVLLAAVVVGDVRSLKIPNALPASLIALYPVYVLTATRPVAWLPAIGIAALVFVVGVIAFACRRIGGGDVKLLAAVALWAGPELIAPTLVYTALIGGALALVMISPLRFAIAFASDYARLPSLRDVMLGRHLPYGVAIAGAAALTVGGRLLSAL
jgi:prepilin peptidase CpaA